MAKLSAAQRKALPQSTFAGPDRSFPIPDKGHAKAALGLINNAPPAARPKIRAKAEAMLHPSDRGHVTHNPANAVPSSAKHGKGTRSNMGGQGGKKGYY